ncbi:MAG TPA: 3-oxoacyl-ACP reductase [Planctomycetaceae bacterium]|nr:3-oxoacyl-ACP reductase [Planctomycetaceae bacterium]
MPDSSRPLAVVTGSSSGIGAAIAVRLAESGFNLVIHARRNIRGLTETARSIASVAPSALVVSATADLRSPTGCRQFFQAAVARQTPSAWVNNAGADILTSAVASSSFEQRLQLLLDVDVQATIRLSRMITQYWHDHFTVATSPASKPCVVNVGWDQARLGMEGEPGQLFGTCKAAVEAFTTSLAMTTGKQARANCVAPGWIQTSWGTSNAADYWHRRATSESLTERWGTPQDVAEAVNWLVSPAAEFINGQTILINGGRRYYPETSTSRVED